MTYASFASTGRPPTPPYGPPLGPRFGPPGAAGSPRPLRRVGVTFAVAVLVGIVEVLLLMLVGRWIGAGLTFLLVLGTSVLGVWLLRREGARSWRAFRTSLSEGRPPGPSATDGLLVLIGGVLIVLPGLLSDLIGALLVLPPTRRLAGRWAQGALARRLTPSAATSLFGPRTVRVRTGAPRQAPPPAPESPPPAETGTGAGTASGGEFIEGEIIDPR